MYKVFFNQKLIIISGTENITLFKTNLQKVDSFGVDDIKKWFLEFIQTDETEIHLVHPSPARFFELFRSAFINISAAGGVVFNPEKKMLFIFRNGVWDLPKGKVEKKETVSEAALREVEEECGISDLTIVKDLPSTFHIYQSPYKKTKGQWIFKETFWFEMNYAGNALGTPQQEEGITKTEWFFPHDLDSVISNTYENLKQIINIYRD